MACGCILKIISLRALRPLAKRAREYFLLFSKQESGKAGTTGFCRGPAFGGMAARAMGNHIGLPLQLWFHPGLKVHRLAMTVGFRPLWPVHHYLPLSDRFPRRAHNGGGFIDPQ